MHHRGWGRCEWHASQDRAQHFGKTATFSWELGNPIVAREHFCSEVSGWLFSIRLYKNDKFVGIRHSLETEKKALKQPTPKKGSEFIHVCAVCTTKCRQFKQCA